MSDDFVFDPRLAVSALSSMRWNLEQDVEYYVEAGVRHVSLWAAKLERDGWSIVDAGRMLAERGIAVDTVCASGPISGDAAASARLIDELRGAAEIGARALCVTHGSGHGKTYELARKEFLPRVTPVLAEARRLGLDLILEGTRPQFAHLSFVHTYASSVALAREVGARVIFDTAHFWWEPGLADAVRGSGDVLGLVQVADLDFAAPVLERRIPGEGDLELREMLGWVREAGYGGPIEVEVLGATVEQESPDAVLERSARFLAGLLPENSAHR